MGPRSIVSAAIFCLCVSSAHAQTVRIQDLPQFDTVYAINNSDLIVGSAGNRAVVGRPGEAVTVIDGGLGSWSTARAVNDHGQVAGQYFVPSLGGSQAFFYDPDLGTVDLFEADTRSHTATLNDQGQMFWVTWADSGQWMNVRDESGQVMSLPIPSSGSVIEANDRGQALSSHGGTVSGVTTYSAGALSHVQIDAPDYFYTDLQDINDLGQAVGRLGTPNRAALWDEDDGLRELIGPGEADGFDHIADTINNHGLVALTLISVTHSSDVEFAFYSPDRGLIRLEQPEFPEPAACAAGTFNVSTYAGVGIGSAPDATLNDRGQALVRIRLACRVGHGYPVIYIPAVATAEGGIELIPLPRGLVLEDLFGEVVDEHGQTVNLYESVALTYGALNEHGRMIGNFRTRSWDGTFVSTAHLYDLNPDPAADVRVNGSDGPLFVTADESVNVALSFDPGGRSGEPGEYWTAVYSSFGSVLLFNAEAELTGFNEVALFDVPLPAGWYLFLFNVEDTPDGVYRPGWLDYAVVIVTP